MKAIWIFLLLFFVSGLQAEPPGIYRNLPGEIECPLDNWMIETSVPYFNTWREWGITANTLTLMGGIIQLIACLFLYHRYGVVAGILWLFGYYFDAIDGSYARYHHLVSAYGDIFDHLRDWTCFAVLVLVVFWRYSWHTIDTLFLLACCFMVMFFMGAQEQYVISSGKGEGSLMLSPITWMIRKFDFDLGVLLPWLRWFGVAHINALVGLYLAFLPHFKRNRGPR